MLTQQNHDHANRSAALLNTSKHVLKTFYPYISLFVPTFILNKLIFLIAYNSDELISHLITIVETSVQTEAIIYN